MTINTNAVSDDEEQTEIVRNLLHRDVDPNIVIELTKLTAIDDELLEEVLFTHSSCVTFYGRRIEELLDEHLDALKPPDEEIVVREMRLLLLGQPPLLRKVCYVVPRKRLLMIVGCDGELVSYAHDGERWTTADSVEELRGVDAVDAIFLYRHD